MPPDAVKVIDTGRARRFIDVLNMEGHGGATVLAPLVRSAYLWDAGVHFQHGGRGMKAPSHSELAAFLAANPELTDAAARGQDINRGGRRLIGAPIAALAYWLCSRIDHDDAEVG